MDDNAALQALNEMIPYLEAMDTKTTAILRALEQNGMVTEKQLAPHLEHAANATNVKWLAVRVRIERLLAAKTENSGKEAPSKGKDMASKKAETDTIEPVQNPDEDDNSSSGSEENSGGESPA